ncbi:polysaccharide pyruvyl transferase family protein [Subtercola boreus]|uniref:polysaccharide pyruvyl transferase family protein n=1 Tax=Subtercola boreus TaxID=120213 RepID=UPI0011C03FF9|nr:polysaccharide pyruvyl transferase family protein [Subtercola boreus]
MAKKYILLVGVEFNNQGAYLMLLAAAKVIREQFDAIPVVEFHNGTEEKKRIAGVSALVPQRTYGVITRARRFRPLRRLWKKFPYVLPTELLAVFDGSGFRYGDQWVNSNLDYTAGKLRDWAARGVPVYMLPQAFGPFEKTAGPSLTAMKASRIVFPRDAESETYVRDILTGQTPKVHRHPDFTAGLEGRFPTGYEAYRGRVPIIPNYNIYSRADDGDSQERYLSNLTAIVEHLHGKGLQPYGLAHEGRKDVEILEKVKQRVKSQSSINLELVGGLSGLELKGLIGTAPLIVSGRYHAIVSALSQGVPAVIHGWSHKYRYVADDFDARELQCDPLAAADESIAVIETIIGNTELTGRISAAAQRVKAEMKDMWAEIEADLRPTQNR